MKFSNPLAAAAAVFVSIPLALSVVGSFSPAEAKPPSGKPFVTLSDTDDDLQRQIDAIAVAVLPEEIPVDCDAGDVLQDAIDAAIPTTLILVTGTCNENIQVDASKRSLTIDGQGSASIAADEAGGPAVTIRGSDITIRNFDRDGSISGGGRGIVVSSSASARIESNTVEGAATAGITVEGGSFAKIVGNLVRNHGGNGIAVTEGSAARIGDDCTLAAFNAITSNGSSGITILQNSEATVRGALIQGNGSNGIFITDNSMADTASNSISLNGGNGVEVRRGSSVRMGRRDTPEPGCADDPNDSLNDNTGGFGIVCGSLSTVDGELGTLNGTAGPTSLNDANADCPNCCFANVDETPQPSAVTVFVTGPTYQGDLGELDPSGNGIGLAGADAACRQRAEAAGLAGTSWRAWLTDSNNTSARDRIPVGEYRLVDGTLVADDLADLTDGALNAPINLDEFGQAVADLVWTASEADGSGTGNNCNDWTDNSSEQGGCPAGDPNCGSSGSSAATDSEWTKLGAPFQCSAFQHLYCFVGNQ